MPFFYTNDFKYKNHHDSDDSTILKVSQHFGQRKLFALFKGDLDEELNGHLSKIFGHWI